MRRSYFHRGDEQIGNAGFVQLAELGELSSIDTVEQKNRFAEDLAFVERLECARRIGPVGCDHHFCITFADFIHACIENQFAVLDEDQVGEDMLDFLDLMRGHEDGLLFVEIVVEQARVELLAIQDIQAQGRLIEHEQLGVDRHDQGQMQLHDHALGQLAHTLSRFDLGAREEGEAFLARETRMHAADEVDRVADAQPARQHGAIASAIEARPMTASTGYAGCADSVRAPRVRRRIRLGRVSP